MSIDLVGLAYDEELVDSFWWKVPVRVAYNIILTDEFRRKVDLRSLLYHKGQIDLLSELDSFIRQGGADYTLVELLAHRFDAGVEDFPSKSGEFSFDFKMIRHFTSLAMADDFLVAEPFLRNLLQRIGFLKNGAAWSLLEVRDFDGVASALRDVRMQDILEAGRKVIGQSSAISLEHLVRNYIEFLSYARNNRFRPFFYNSESDFKRWGDLIERKEKRNELVVDLAMRSKRKKPSPITIKAPPKRENKDLQERMKLRRECDSLLEGLKDPDTIIRQKAAESLGRLAEEETLPHLLEALQEPEEEVRQEIVRALGSLEHPQAISALLHVMEEDPSLSVSLTAAFLLRNSSVQEAIPIMVDQLEKGKPHFATLLGYHAGLKSDRATLARLETLAFHENPTVRRDVAFVLGRLKVPMAQKILLNLLQDADDETQSNALYSLWDCGAKDLDKILAGFTAKNSSAAQAKEILSNWTQNQN